MSVFWRFAREMGRYRLTLTAAVLFAFVSAASLGAGLLSLAPILKLILRPEGGQSLATLAREFNTGDHAFRIPDALIARLPEDAFLGVVVIISGLLVMTVIGAAANFTHQYLSFTVVTRTVARIRQAAFRHVINLPLGRVIERGPSEFVSRIIRDAAELQGGLIALTSKAIAQVTKGLAAFIVAVLIEPRLTLITLVVVPLLAIVLRKLGKRIRRGSRGLLKAQEQLLRVSTEAVQGLRAVKANTGEPEAARRFHEINKRVVREEMRVRIVRAMSGPIVETLALVVLCGLAILAARQILSGRLLFENFILALGSLGVAGASFKPLTALVNEMHAASAPAARLLEITDEPRESAGSVMRRRLPRHARSIEFERIIFSYPGADQRALDDLSLRIEHGRRIAIVGPNGCGKTTLLSMLPRLLRPSSGRVLIDGVDIESVSLRSLRRQLGVVTQETVLFRGSIAFNIGFGVPGVSREAIVDAARRAHAHEFIERLSDGYDADVAEQGASLSGGQRQRLAIARAILRDPAILILDEATSQIDAESEAHINEALASFCHGRTALIIAHRLSTVLNADCIIVMDAGRIVDQGTHDELIGRCDLYQRLASTQLVAGG